jgi:hypothetical protein
LSNGVRVLAKSRTDIFKKKTEPDDVARWEHKQREDRPKSGTVNPIKHKQSYRSWRVDREHCNRARNQDENDD